MLYNRCKINILGESKRIIAMLFNISQKVL